MSSLKCGLMPLTQESCLVGKVSYHDSFGPEVDAAAVQRDLGVHNKVMLLRNGGALCCGETVEEAFFYAKNLVQACEAQVGGMMGNCFLIAVGKPLPGITRGSRDYLEIRVHVICVTRERCTSLKDLLTVYYCFMYVIN